MTSNKEHAAENMRSGPPTAVPAIHFRRVGSKMTLLLTRLVRGFQRRRDLSFSAWLRTLPADELNRWFLRMHELLGIDIPDICEMSDLEFEDYIARLRRLKGLHVAL
jgi:hypothetical protein